MPFLANKTLDIVVPYTAFENAHKFNLVSRVQKADLVKVMHGGEILSPKVARTQLLAL